MNKMQEDRIPLGATDIRISPMGVGAWAWGDTWFWGYGRSNYGEDDVKAAFDTTVMNDINFVDTAEIYGRGKSERLVGKFLPDAQTPLVVATKFFPWPWRFTGSRLLAALRGSLERLNLRQVDLYQIHWPNPPVSIETWMQAMADAVELGLTRAVGVSNYDLDQTQRAQRALAGRAIPLASNQVRFSLLTRDAEHSGLLDYCQQQDITLIAYSPLEQGMLTGKYTAGRPPGGTCRWRYRPDFLASLQPLLALMGEIGQSYGNKSPAQVALNWVILRAPSPSLALKTHARPVKTLAHWAGA